MAYFFVKYKVDRYNVYFASSPSHVSHKIHVLAIRFVLLGMIFMYGGFFALLWVRVGWRNVTYAACFLVYISIFVFLLAFNPMNWKAAIVRAGYAPFSKIKRQYRVIYRSAEQREYSHTSPFGAVIAGNSSGTRFLEDPSGHSPFFLEPLQLM
ncbi:CSC1-like protein 1 [Trichonephila clavipes]|nr:CSC1-like protein 1 [Trichonephila clavipes]